MGNSESKKKEFGLRIIHLEEESPAKKAGLNEFVDFIVEISGSINRVPFPSQYLCSQNHSQADKKGEEEALQIKTYNILTRKFVTVIISLSEVSDLQEPYLGIVVREEEYTNAHERVLRISQVYQNSPAFDSGCIPDQDYIISSPDFTLTNFPEFISYVQHAEGEKKSKAIRLCLYDSNNRTTRMTNLFPNKNWGGKGLLGCEFADGVLNFLPQIDIEIKDSVERNSEQNEQSNSLDLEEKDYLEEAKTKEKKDNHEITPKRDSEGSFEKLEIQLDNLFMNETPVHKNTHPFEAIDSKEDQYYQTKSKFNFSNVQQQKASAKYIPRPRQSFRNMTEKRIEKTYSTHITGVSTQLSDSKTFFPSGESFKDSSKTNIQFSSQPSSPNSTGGIRQKQFQFKNTKMQETKLRRVTEGSKKVDRSNFKLSEEIREINFQGVERIEHIDNEVHDFPKLLFSNTHDPTNQTTTILERSVFDSQIQNKSIDLNENFEKPLCKTVIQYTFQSKKLGGDYTIKSTDLFNEDYFKTNY